MYKIKIYSPGKTKEIWLTAALQEYTKRLQNAIEISWFYPKSDKELVEALGKEKNPICLDPAGKLFTSEEFSTFFYESLEQEGSRLTFVIGGCDGLPQELKARCKTLFSLSRMTFTHLMTRLLLVEQIYRAHEIAKGSGYHK